jgi:hypothetical protein
MPLQLIDKKDNWEIARDEIAAILKKETLNQQQKATEAGKDPDEWKFQVLIERTRPFEFEKENDLEVPRVVVSFESLSFSDNSGVSLTQFARAVYNIDIFCSGTAVKKSAGSTAADYLSTIALQRIMRLIRNIFYSVPADASVAGEDYTYLNLRGVVGLCEITNMSVFSSKYDENGRVISAGRISFEVSMREDALEGPYNNLELIQMLMNVNEQGIVELQIDVS